MPIPSRTNGVRRLWLAAGITAALIVPLAVPPALPAQSDEIPESSQLDPPAVPQRLLFPTIVIRRDPFVNDDLVAADEPAFGDAAATQGMVLPPNAAVSSMENGPTDSPGMPAVVRGVILGPVPKALVDVGGRSIVVGIGSPLATSLVAAIAANGIRLQDGERLPFTDKRL